MYIAMTSLPHGGLVIAMKNNLDLINIQKGKEVELIAGKDNISKTKKMTFASYYRPPDKNNEDYHNMVKEELTDLRKKYKNAVLIIGWDLIQPDIDWHKNIVSTNDIPIDIRVLIRIVTPAIPCEPHVK